MLCTTACAVEVMHHGHVTSRALDAFPALDVGALRLLGQPLRARIVELLAGEALCTCHLVELTGARQTAISNQLAALLRAGWVSREPCGRFTYYRLEPEALTALSRQLAGVAALAASSSGRRRPC